MFPAYHLSAECALLSTVTEATETVGLTQSIVVETRSGSLYLPDPSFERTLIDHFPSRLPSHGRETVAVPVVEVGLVVAPAESVWVVASRVADRTSIAAMPLESVALKVSTSGPAACPLYAPGSLAIVIVGA